MDKEKVYLNRTRGYHGHFQRVMQRKKICPTCGKLLWRRDFYVIKGKGITSDCKECVKKKRREKYKLKHKDGFYHDEIGRPIEYRNGYRRLDWTPQMLSDLKKLYPTTKNDELAGIFMMSAKSVARKAKSLGIQKDKAWMAAISKENSLLGGYANKRRVARLKSNESI